MAILGAERAALADQSISPAGRAPSDVMRLDRMGASYPTRLSFLRILLRRMSREKWQIAPTRIDLDDDGVGHVTIEARGPARTYTLVAFAHALAPEQRSDRVIADAWDATFALVDGVATPDDIARLATAVPKQERARCTPRELVLSRANRSGRIFDAVVDALARGDAPDMQTVHEVGYLMRTTAVYGNGKFGIADREKYADRPELAAPFQAEMLTVYLIRTFSHLLVEHLATRQKSAEANNHRCKPCRLPDEAKRALGIGNATGLGMAPFMVSHPRLIHNWVAARETARARVCAQPTATPQAAAHARALFANARRMIAAWHVADPVQTARLDRLRAELTAIPDDAIARHLTAPYPWRTLVESVQDGSLELQELVTSLILEPHADIVDALTHELADHDHDRFDPCMTIAEMRALLVTHYAWSRDISPNDPNANAQFWYTSVEKREPRIGNRHEEPGAEKELPLHVARDIRAFDAALAAWAQPTPNAPVAELLMAAPQHRDIARRVQTIATHPYGEVHDNLVADTMRPIDLLRFKLAFFGATKFDPKSDLWTRITLFKGAPLAEDVAAGNAESGDWMFSSPATTIRSSV